MAKIADFEGRRVSFNEMLKILQGGEEGFKSKSVQFEGNVDKTVQFSSTMAENSYVATAIAAAIKQQDAATRQITCSVHEAAEGTNQASLNIRGLAKVSTDNGKAAGQVLD